MTVPSHRPINNKSTIVFVTSVQNYWLQSIKISFFSAKTCLVNFYCPLLCLPHFPLQFVPDFVSFLPSSTFSYSFFTASLTQPWRPSALEPALGSVSIFFEYSPYPHTHKFIHSSKTPSSVNIRSGPGPATLPPISNVIREWLPSLPCQVDQQRCLQFQLTHTPHHPQTSVRPSARLSVRHPLTRNSELISTSRLALHPPSRT